MALGVVDSKDVMVAKKKGGGDKTPADPVDKTETDAPEVTQVPEKSEGQSPEPAVEPAVTEPEGATAQDTADATADGEPATQAPAEQNAATEAAPDPETADPETLNPNDITDAEVVADYPPEGTLDDLAEDPPQRAEEMAPEEGSDGQPADDQTADDAPGADTLGAAGTTETAEAAAPSEPETRTAPAPAQTRGGGMISTILGGVIAAGIGFGAAQIYPDGWPIGADTQTVAAVADNSSQITTLNEDIAMLRARVEDGSVTADLGSRIDTLAGQIASLQGELATVQNEIGATRESLSGRIESLAADLTDRIVTLEKAPIEQAADAAVAGAVRAYQSEVEALRDETRQRFETLSGEVEARLGEGSAMISEALEANRRMEAEREAREADARAAEEAARRAVALSRLQTALETGAPFAEPLENLPDAPAPLPELAETGVPTQADLQQAFPPLARQALQAGLRETRGDSAEDRVTTFLRTQLGMRSLVPTEGNDPDAVLSRVEAAIGAGDLALATETAAALPDSARAVLEDWLAQVDTRRAALDAAATLGDAENTN